MINSFLLSLFRFPCYQKSLHLKLRDEGISFRGTTLIDMLFRLVPFRSTEDHMSAQGFCSRVRHPNPHTASHRPAALLNAIIGFIPFIASLLNCKIMHGNNIDYAICFVKASLPRFYMFSQRSYFNCRRCLPENILNMISIWLQVAIFENIDLVRKVIS